jgi:hypothetical protein
VRVLLANPRWERRLVKFLELSGVGRVMADGTDEDGAYAARMDEWVAWETVEGAAPRGDVFGCGVLVFCLVFLFQFSFSKFSCKGGSYPETCAQRTAEGGGFPMLWWVARGWLQDRLLCLSWAAYPLGVNGAVSRTK